MNEVPQMEDFLSHIFLKAKQQEAPDREEWLRI